MKPAPNQVSRTAPKLNEPPEGASNREEEVALRHNDADLVGRVQRGDQAAFRSLFDRYHRRAFAIAFGVVKNQQDALDVMQEAFIKVHRHIGSFHGASSFYTWLYRIVMNLSIDHVRRARKVTDFDDTLQRSEAERDSPHLARLEGESPGRTAARRELSVHIQAALAELPEYHRAVILLREVEGLSYEEMAVILKVPKGTIMSRLFHARRKMQERLAPYLEGDLDITE